MSAGPVTDARRLLPLHDESAPVACTLGVDDLAERLALIDRLRRRTTSIERTATGLLLVLPRTDANLEEVRRFAEDEQQCCAFWGFAVIEGDDQVVLRWDGPPSVSDWFDAIELG